MSEFNKDQHEHLSSQFTALDLSHSHFEDKEFDGCTFTRCDFSESTFSHCKFIDCQFIECNLSVVKLDYSRFIDVEFEACKMIGIDWSKADWPRLSFSSPVAFKGCILNDSSFMGLELHELRLQDCKAHDVNFREGDFSDGDFSYTDFSYSVFGKTTLKGVNFTEASHYAIDVFRNNIKHATFSRFEALNLLDSLEIELVD